MNALSESGFFKNVESIKYSKELNNNERDYNNGINQIFLFTFKILEKSF